MRRCKALRLGTVLIALVPYCVSAQTTDQQSLAEQVQKLTEAMERTEAQVKQSQQQLDDMRKQLSELQRQMAQNEAKPAPGPTPAPSSQASSGAAASAAIQDIRERQAMQQTQITTQEQAKVESESRYPVKITGLLLLNGFVNTGAVDIASTPAVALPGSGSTGGSVRQTVLGFEARGPHLFGARTYADLRVDFDGSPASDVSTSAFSGYYSSTTALLRLRTAHAGLRWNNIEAYFALDRPIFNPDMPASLTAVAIPALAWSGNLWTWNPQLGLNFDLDSSNALTVRMQAALIGVEDAPLSPFAPNPANANTPPPTTAEQSRWPGVEARLALLGPHPNEHVPYSHFGVGGYFAPHSSTLLGHGFDSWAGTLDARFLLPARLQWTGNFYRGQALGGLGGGAFKDFVYRQNSNLSGNFLRPLDDVGGWTELKEKLSERIEFNALYGTDDVFARELRFYAVQGGTMYQNLARNRTFAGNVIFSPSSYLLFSLEYRHLESFRIVGLPSSSNIFGLGAGYRF
ncbi:MAG TPA: hypothetical protein VFW25_10165 [Silvibacterium sp.]|nr:hypothetical protein [Silvibacterium sp.]